MKRLTALEEVSVQTTRHILTLSRFASRLLAAPHYSTSITEAPTLSELPESTSVPFELALGTTLSPQSSMSFAQPRPALGTSIPSHTSVPSQSPMSFVPPQPASDTSTPSHTSIPSQSPMSSIPSQLVLGSSASSQFSSVQPPQLTSTLPVSNHLHYMEGTAEGSDVPL